MAKVRSASEISAIEVALGVNSGIMSKLVKKAQKRGVPTGNIYRLETPDGESHLDKMVDVLAGMSLEIVPPVGGRIYSVRVPIVLDREWQEAITAAGPNTSDNYNVRKVGDLYRPTGTGRAWADMTLMNFGPSGGGRSLEKAIEWAKSYGLKLTVPRQIFAIGEYRPKLDAELEMNPMYIVATTECSFGGNRQVCRVWFVGAERGADLGWVGGVAGSGVWFAFVRE